MTEDNVVIATSIMALLLCVFGVIGVAALLA
jgi:hypothetical protein